MQKLVYIVFLVFASIAVDTSCKKPYNPPAVMADNRFLVVNGNLISNLDSPSVITLSRTVKLTDTTLMSFPETGATVLVEGDGGDNYSFKELPGGVYRSSPLQLNASGKYRLKINTSIGKQYESEFVDLVQTPPIDSVTWEQQNDVIIYLYSHDPLNKTKYYQWDFTETYQYASPLNAELSQDNGTLFYVDSTNQTYNCWRSVNSSEILLGSSVALSEDVISKAPIGTVLQNSQKISIRYSILVNQYGLTQKAYQYLQILKKNTENLGSIFDAQPTQLIGNIHALQDPEELVIGFFSASTIQQKRIFISKGQVKDWNFVDTNRECSIMTIPHSPPFFSYTYPDPGFAPYYFSGSTSLVIARKECVDCRLRGGVNIPPSYW